MRRTILPFLLLLSIAACSNSTFAQVDPGIPDSMLISGGPLVLGKSVPLSFTIKNDETLSAFAAQTKMVTQNTGFARLDSIVYVNRMADPTVLSTRFRFLHVDGVPTDSFAIYAANAGEEHLTAGSTPVFQMYFTGLSLGRMSIRPYLNFTGDVSSVFISGDPSATAVPVAQPAFTVNIIEQAVPPFITSSDTVVRAVAGSTIQVPISYGSSLGLETVATIESVVGVDDNQATPTNLPVILTNGSPIIEWSTLSTETRIWKISLKATDSNNSTSSMSIEVQLVDSPEQLVPFATFAKPSEVSATTLAIGNFDSDTEPELFVTGGYSVVAGAYLFDINESGFENTYSYDLESHKSGARAGYLDSDSHLDVVTTGWGVGYQFEMMIQTYLGEGTAFTSVQEEMQFSFAKSATLGEFTGDSHIDYAIASRNSLVIFESDGDGTFSNPNAISVPDTAISLNSADFNLDGRDDLALGTKRGLKIYRQTGKQTFVPVATYPQDYGSVDLDITNSGSDFNSDGKFDLCIASPSVGGAKSKMMIYYGNGDCTFNQTEIREINGQILATCVGDFNNDTELDIAFVNGSSRYVGIIFGNGNGNFEGEIRYQIPDFNPRLIDCLDYDLDGDLDMIVSAAGGVGDNAFFLLTNENNPPGFSAGQFEVSVEDNAQIAVTAPGGSQLTDVANSIPAASMYKRDLNNNDVLDGYACLGVVESGEYIIKALPKPDQPATSTFSLEYSFGGQQFSLAKDCPMQAAGFEFGVPLDANVIKPQPGSFVSATIGSFQWQGSGQFDFQLATDILFENIVHQQTVSGNNLPFSSDLGYSDTTAYFWRVKPTTESQYGKLYSFSVTGTATDVEDVSGATLPLTFSLAQNYPNPFNPTTRIEFELPRSEKATVRVTNILGETVATLLDEVLAAGRHVVEWRGTDRSGKAVPSGVYFYSLKAGDFSDVRKMVLLK